MKSHVSGRARTLCDELKSVPDSLWVALISATHLHSVYGDLNWEFLRGKEPIAKIGYSIFVYEFDSPIRFRFQPEAL